MVKKCGRLFLSFVLVLAMVMGMLTGCGKKAPKETEADWKDPGQEWKDPSKPSDEETTGTSDWVDTNQPSETETAAAELTEEGYRHEIDGWVYYTQHNIDDYIEGDVFYASKMAEDAFDAKVDTVDNGHVVLKSIAVLRYGAYNNNNDRDTYSDANWIGFELAYKGYSLFIKCTKDSGRQIYKVDGGLHSTCREIAELSLYICENVGTWKKNDFWSAVAIHLPARYYAWDIYNGAQ